MRHLFLGIMTSLLAFTMPARGQGVYKYPFQNPSLPIEERVDDLVSRMTIDEKIGQMMEKAPAIERLGIPQYNWWNECLHGIAWAGKATVFPQAVALASTFDREGIFDMATKISDEARAKHHEFASRNERNIFQGLTFWSPNINIFRDPRWGRGQETYGEDPYLSGAIGTQFVKGLQGDDPKYFKVIATAKHYAVHSGPEYNRSTFNSIIDDRDLWDTYLPAFRTLVKEAHVYSVMCAYNRLNGEPCCGDENLLYKILREKWGFNGYVVSDCGAIDWMWKEHKVFPGAAEASAKSVLAGTDLECGHNWIDSWSYRQLMKAIEIGQIKESDIDRAVKRLFTARMKLGMFDPDEMVTYTKIPYSVVDCQAHRDAALDLARKSTILLKNDGTLPLDTAKIKKIAIVGPNADNPRALLGNYNGEPSFIISPLDGIKSKLGKNTKVIYEKGVNLTDDWTPMHDEFFSSVTFGGSKGFKGEYFRNTELKGEPALIRMDTKIDFEGDSTRQIAPEIYAKEISVKWTGVFVPKKSEELRFMLHGDDGFRMIVNGDTIINDFVSKWPRSGNAAIKVEKGKKYDIEIDYFQKYEGALVRLETYRHADFDAIFNKVKDADVIIYIGGISPRLEGEEMRVDAPGFKGGDKLNIELPEVQQRLSRTLKKTEKPVVFVMLTGSALAVNWENDNLSAVINAWYGGQSGGQAIADVIFGDYNPSGRLPVTFYKTTEDLPDFEDYAMKNRTYRYYKGEVLYPFGHGLSYTTFKYSNLIAPKEIKISQEAETSVLVKVKVTNTGKMAGEEVVQLYVSHKNKTLPTAIRTLKGFQRVKLDKGESKEVQFILSPEDIGVLDENNNLVVEPGEFEIYVGGSQPFKVKKDKKTKNWATPAKGLTKKVKISGETVVVDSID